MSWALYHPDTGYYAEPDLQRIGRAGDYITSVSVGPLFGELLARRFLDLWRTHQRPSPFTLIEAGPEDGQLAADLLAAAAALEPGFRKALHYVALEPMPRKREAVAERISPEPNATAVSSADEIRAGFGVVLANEVLDALPVHLLEFSHGTWHERAVSLDEEGNLALALASPTDPRLVSFTERLGTTFPDGYRTEVCLDYEDFLAPLAAAVDRGLFVLIDYGFSESDYYHPARSKGTLRCYHRHQAVDDPLLRPGRQDITTHVNFSAVEAAAGNLGLEPAGIVSQERYLTRLAAPLLKQMDARDETARDTLLQFRTLTHPAFLGSRFHVAEFTRNL